MTGNRRHRPRKLVYGITAGAVGTTALNAVTYLDMAVRGRPPSTTPEESVRRGEELAHLQLSRRGPDSAPATNRRSGLGALLGIATGVGAGVVYGLVRGRLPNAPLPLMGLVAGLGATVAGMGPMTALGVTDPRQWTATSWAMDIGPHLAYGYATAAAFDGLAGHSDGSRKGRTTWAPWR